MMCVSFIHSYTGGLASDSVAVQLDTCCHYYKRSCVGATDTTRQRKRFGAFGLYVRKYRFEIENNLIKWPVGDPNYAKTSTESRCEDATRIIYMP